MKAQPLSRVEKELWWSFGSAYATLANEVGAELETATGVSLTDFQALSELRRGPLRMLELAQRLTMTRGGTTRVVRRLERLEYAQRRRTEHDGRGTYAEITASGYAQLKAAETHIAQSLRTRFFAPLDGNQATLQHLLNCLLNPEKLT